MARIASFHLVRESALRTPLALARLGTDRLRLRRVPGLLFWRVLGSGRDDRTGPGADLARTALFAVWEDEAALDRFLETHRIAQRRQTADEHWSVRLRGLGGHGRWRQFDPLADLEAGSPGTPVAVITRAAVRPGAWREFTRASRLVDAELHRAAGLLDVVAIGEAPVGRLATFSLWESLEAATAFAYSMPGHREVVRRTRDETWYTEEFFGRFEPYGSTGTWNGRDPLRDVPG